MARNLPPRRPFVTRPVRRPALGVQQNRVVTIMGEADYTGSTLTASTFALTANGSATTTLEATVYRDGVLSAGEQVTYTVQRIQMNAADSFVSADPSDIDSDGVATSTITVQAKYREDGAEDYIALPGIPAASVVLAAATTTGNTLTQPATETDVNGVTTGTLKTTDALTSKTVSATIAGLAVTDTAVITTDGGYVPPAPGTPFFEDSFAGTQVNNANGFVWGGAGSRTAVVSFDGYNAMRFRFGPDATGADSTAERRFTLGVDCDEMWIEYDWYVPSNFSHRNDAPNNNKFLMLWRDTYGSGSGTWQVGYEYRRGTSDAQSTIRPMSSLESGPTALYVTSDNLNHPDHNKVMIDAAGPIIPGGWYQIRHYVKASSGAGQADGVMKMWIDGVLFASMTNGLFRNYGNSPSDVALRQGYFMGWSNSGFTEQTDFYIKAVKFYNTDPAW